MSYILDALRRAQADRERGRLPGLQSQTELPLARAAASNSGLPLRSARPAVVLALLLAGAAAVWWGTRMAAPKAPAPVAVGPQTAPPPVTAAAAPTPALPARAELPTVVSAPPAPLPEPAAQAAVPGGAAESTAMPAQPARQAPPAAPSARPPAAPDAAPPPPVTPLAALPPDLQRELPPLVVGGSVWSENAASRFVILNGQLVHEGQAAAPGVVVERITQRSAVLRWRERRIELPL